MKKRLFVLCIVMILIVMIPRRDISCVHVWNYDPKTGITTDMGEKTPEQLGIDFSMSVLGMSAEQAQAAWNRMNGIPVPTENGDGTAPVGGKTPATSLNAACEHEYTSEVLEEPTCSTEGEMVYTCSKCGNIYTEPIPATGQHDCEEVITREPTCMIPGQKTRTCKACGMEQHEALVPTGHKWSNPIITEPTCTESGQRVIECLNCGLTDKTRVPAKGHVESEWNTVIPAGAFSIGLQTKSCTVCNAILNARELPQICPTWVLYMCVLMLILLIIAGGLFFINYEKKMNLYKK